MESKAVKSWHLLIIICDARAIVLSGVSPERQLASFLRLSIIAWGSPAPSSTIHFRRGRYKLGTTLICLKFPPLNISYCSIHLCLPLPSSPFPNNKHVWAANTEQTDEHLHCI